MKNTPSPVNRRHLRPSLIASLVTVVTLSLLLTWHPKAPGIPLARKPADLVTDLTSYRSLLAEARHRAGPGTMAARRGRRALLETEIAWADAGIAVTTEAKSAAAKSVATAFAAGPDNTNENVGCGCAEACLVSN